MDAPDRKFSVGGLKLSEELAQIRFAPSAERPVLEMIRRLAEGQINLLGLVLDVRGGQEGGVCTILAEDRNKAEEVLQPFAGSFEMIGSVGSLTLFPVQSRSELLGTVLSIWAEAGLPIFCIASSSTSLTLTTDFHRLDEAVSVLSRVLSWPENHAPFRPSYRVKQI